MVGERGLRLFEPPFGPLLKQRCLASLGSNPVSYTHLDVYKRQALLAEYFFYCHYFS